MTDYTGATRIPNSPLGPMLDLSDQLPFAQGSNRKCFRHPLDSTRCLKVIRPENITARYERQSPVKRLLGKGRINDNAQEIRAHQQRAIQQLLKQGNDALVWAHLPRFYGSTQTSLGMANESELIRCMDGSVAPTLEHLIKTQGLTPDLNLGIEEFLVWLSQAKILTRNLLPHNLVVSDQFDHPRLFLIDGLGAPTIPQTLDSVPGWSSRYIKRKIERFKTRLAWEQSNEGLSWEDFQHLR
ncbi:PhoP regulatory network YrbL family protein [Marinobacter sp. AL4B]|uniref:PhoP regulatory network YrbL family protein n=1 Tax=Marinobacter sp. AL4B TaxID=2871173 RepID=UPI0021CD920F|nr:PhoP regulatory network YrbL family protein [Marinobacter sp. AL4B]